MEPSIVSVNEPSVVGVSVSVRVMKTV